MLRGRAPALAVVSRLAMRPTVFVRAGFALGYCIVLRTEFSPSPEKTSRDSLVLPTFGARSRHCFQPPPHDGSQACPLHDPSQTAARNSTKSLAGPYDLRSSDPYRTLMDTSRRRPMNLVRQQKPGAENGRPSMSRPSSTPGRGPRCESDYRDNLPRRVLDSASAVVRGGHQDGIRMHRLSFSFRKHQDCIQS